MPAERIVAFGPGRVNLIGEHTDYNDGLALPFAIERGVRVDAAALRDRVIEAHALDLGETDRFGLDEVAAAPGWRAFVRGMVAELRGCAAELRGATLRITGDVPQGSGLSSSAALETGLCLALLGLADVEEFDGTALAKLCSRVENAWVGAQTGLLDQLASLCGAEGSALLIDFRGPQIERVALDLADWRLVTLDSGESHAHAGSRYNERRAECARACELLGIGSLRDASAATIGSLPSPLRERARHVLEENARVELAVAALRAGDLPELGRLLDSSHASLRDLYAVSTPAVEHAVERLQASGAAGARLVGGGFGGNVLGLMPPGTRLPRGAQAVRPAAGARILERS